MWPRVVLLLAATFLAGCTKLRAQAASGAADAGSATSAPAQPARTAVPMAGEREIRVTKLLSTGEVLAASAYILFRFPAEAGATVREIPVPAGHTVDRLAVARAADVAFAWTDDGALYRLRGTALEPFATKVRVASVSDAGNVVEARLEGGVIAYLDGATGKELRRLQATDQKHDVLGYEARLSPDGRWAFASGAIVATDGARPDVPIAKADGVDWLGTTALLFDTGAVLFTDPAARTTRRVPVCDGVMRFDRVVPRVVVACAKQVDVVALPGGERVSIPVPAVRGQAPEHLEPARDGLTLHGAWGHSTEAYPAQHFVIDPLARTAKPDPSSPPLRGWGGEPAEAGATVADCWGCGMSGDASRFVVPPRFAGGPLRVFDAKGRPTVPFGRLSTEGRVTYRARGLDVTWSAGRAGPGALRVGPAAPPPEEAPVPKERQPLREGGCPIGPGARHAAISSGELWMARHISAFDDMTSSCVCEAGRCAKPPIPPHLQLLDGRGDVLVLGTRDPKAGQIHVTSATGASRGVAMAEGHCLDARIHEDGKAASVLCKDATSTFVVEVDLASGARTTRTPLAVLGTRHELVAAGPKAFVVVSRHHTSYDVLRVVEPRSGRALATVHAGKDGAVASFPDGTAEIFGDADAVIPALRCLEGTTSKPFAACVDGTLVKGKLAIDL